MAVASSEPVTSIEGIGPAAAAALASVKVYFVFDLLRGSVQTIHSAVHSLASENEVRSWRSMASLLEVADVTPQWAEALVRGKVISVEMLFRKTLDDIDALMSAAKTQGIIQQLPTPAQISYMLKDAAVLSNTGSVTGTLRDNGNEPIANATTRIGSIEQKSDERGRFRLLRIPLAAGLPLHIEHDDYLPLTIESPPIARDVSVIDGRIFVLDARPAGGAGEAEPQTVLSELAGDVLSVPKGEPLKSVAMDAGNLRSRDVLKVYKLYESSPDAGLVSYFKSYEAGRFIVHTVKVPRSSLAPNVKLADQYQVTDEGLEKIKLGPNKLRRYKLRMRLRKKMAGRTVPTDHDEFSAFIQECYAFLRENGYFQEH